MQVKKNEFSHRALMMGDNGFEILWIQLTIQLNHDLVDSLLRILIY